MEQQSFAKKAIFTIGHQFAMLISVICIFASDYCRNAGEGMKAVVLLAISIVGFVVAFVLIGYLTNAISAFNTFDRIGADVVLILLGSVVFLVLSLSLPMDKDYQLADLCVAVGVVCYLLDSLYLMAYSSIVTQIKQRTIIKNCLSYKIINLVVEGLFRHTMFTRALRGFIAWGIGMVGMVILIKGNIWAGLVLIAVSGGIELYFSLQKAKEERDICNAILEITEGNLNQKVDESLFHGEQKQTAQAVNHIRDGLDAAVQDGIKNERMKADLITNVSHDLKTPLTSIINYVNILKREIPESEQAWQHIRVLDEKSQRLKTLLEDLVEVSRLTSGTVKYEMARIDFVELLYEIGGEFDERFESRGLTIVSKLSRLPIVINADGRQLCRAVENLYTNAAKYAKSDTHVTVELFAVDGKAEFSIRNIMDHPIQLDTGDSGDLTERFVRGDKSRTTEGSGLGLSITKEIVTQMGGTFSVKVEEDTYTATISFIIP